MTNNELRDFNSERKIFQFCIITRNLEEKIKKFVEILKIGPWTILTFTEKTVKNFYVDGELVVEPFKFLIALARVGDFEIEVIQPVYGKTIYDRFLEEKGEGLHHIKEKVADKDMATVLDSYKKIGIDVMQTGQFDVDVHYYLNTEPELDFIYELGNCPDIIIPKEMIRIYPEEE